MKRMPFCTIIVLALAVSASAQRYGGGDGTAGAPYQIWTAEQMNAIGLHEEDWDKHFVLMNDIDLSGCTGRQFNCIGKELYMALDKPFTGVFDGNGKTIAGFTYEDTDVAVVAMFRGVGSGGVIRSLGLVNPSVTINVSPDCDWVLDIACLVANVVSGGTVEDCWIEDGYVQGFRHAGLLAGTSAGMIRRCRVSGTASARDYLGGVVGLNAGTIRQTVFQGTAEGVEDIGGLCGSNVYGTIDGCSAAGSVSGHENLGGLCGSNEHGAITKCAATGSVSGQRSLGGLCGMNSGTISDSCATGRVTGGGASRYLGGLCAQNMGEISKCYATGQVTGGTESDYLGGLCGSNSELIADCYATGPVSGGLDSAHVGGLCGRNNSSGAISNAYASGRITGDRYKGGLCGQNEGLVSDCFWDTETSQMTTSDGGAGKTTAEMHQQSAFTGWNFVAIWTIREGLTYPYLRSTGIYGGGAGTADDPYQIRTAAQMNEIGLHEEDWDKHFKLMNDIDLSMYSGTQFNCIGTTFESLLIGEFAGVFDGNGKTIHGFTYESTDEAYIGLFRGLVGVIRNLTLANPSVKVDFSPSCEWPAETGCLVGRSSGTIENCWIENGRVEGSSFVGLLAGTSLYMMTQCRASGTVRGDNCVGGAVGDIGGTVEKCVFSGTVEGTEAVGGFCGWIVGDVDRCTSQASVVGSERVGGLCGSNVGTITNCAALGDVNGESKVGGLVGQNNAHSPFDYWPPFGGIIENSFAACTIAGQTDVGGFVGFDVPDYPHPQALFTSCFWDETIASLLSGISNRSDPDVTGRTTEQMQQHATFTDWDFVDIWRMCVDEAEYPRLSWELGRLGDFTCPDGVGMEDFAYLAQRWLASNTGDAGAADANGDALVNMQDFAVLAGGWGP